MLTRAAGRRVLERVADEVAERLVEEASVARDDSRVSDDVDEMVVEGQQLIDDLLGQLAQAHRFEASGREHPLIARCGQQIVEHGVETVCRMFGGS